MSLSTHVMRRDGAVQTLPSIRHHNARTAKLSGKARVKPLAEVPEDVKLQVQQALQDYLYYSRDFNFTDARYISLNAPCFIRKLLSSVRQRKNINPALQKHLLYNPINEFEPFFESIGIQPCDIHSLLPAHQLFMKENQALLATVSTLSNIGFPRQELGKLYKEHPEIFSSSSKELQKKLQFYENLGVSKLSLVRILICCPSVLNDDVYKNLKAVTSRLNGLQVEKSRICCLNETNLHNRGTVLEKLMLLMGVGCSWDEISKLCHTKSDLLTNGSDESVYFIIEFLSSLGIQKENIGSIFVKCPELLDPKLVESMETSAASFEQYQKEAREKIDLHRSKLIKLHECMVGTVFEKQNFFAFIEERLKSMMPVTSVQEIQICEHLHRHIGRHTLNIFLKAGLSKSSRKMNEAASRIECKSDKLQERFNYLLGLGLPFCAVCKILWVSPNIFSLNLNSVKKKADFLFRSVSNPLQVLEKYPQFLNYSLERRTMPRYEFYKWLRTNNVLKSEFGIMRILRPSEKTFEKTFVEIHPEGKNYFRRCMRKYKHKSSARET
ncbi:transcription termination factor MTEF18, mitochondrial isoform X2 [Cryptomeria japonica]|uniref:transcription termination factor MTEF18, mitochondrial isoform X2 n=1 Tax=Cryptomeria japonica TaxID=3369 RepID=UPI0025AC80EC|nr:transcription termination factor MTEF18, mitochondrial isoform X2 [Cryptomeria japonica]